MIGFGAILVVAAVLLIVPVLYVVKNALKLPVHKVWDRLKAVPFGKYVFSSLIGFISPYTGTVGLSVLDVDTNLGRVWMKERRSVHNPFKSIHFACLCNLSEVAAFLNLSYTLSEAAEKEGFKYRMIPKEVQAVFLKKARGEIVGECVSRTPSSLGRHEHTTCTILRDKDDEEVARINIVWCIDITRKGDFDTKKMK